MQTTTENTNEINDENSFQITQDERQELEESSSTPKASISFRNQNIDVYGLVERLNKDDILIPRIGAANKNLEMNAFQRGFVWSNKQMDSFVESLLLEYPVPGIFLVRQSDRRLVVLDGQQRLETLRMFYEGTRGDRVYSLKLDSSSPYNGITYKTLKDSDRRTLDDTYIECTVISADADNETEAYEAIYDVFARLNSGGTTLTAHEIRMALFNGTLMNEIDRINQIPEWRVLYGAEYPGKRFRDHELVLRIIAMFVDGQRYEKPLAKFLNGFSSKYRNNLCPEIISALDLFQKACEILSPCVDGDRRIFSLSGSRQINNAKADSIMVGMMQVISNSGATDWDAGKLNCALHKLDTNEDYIDSISKATSDEALVRKRIAITREAFVDAVASC